MLGLWQVATSMTANYDPLEAGKENCHGGRNWEKEKEPSVSDGGHSQQAAVKDSEGWIKLFAKYLPSKGARKMNSVLETELGNDALSTNKYQDCRHGEKLLLLTAKQTSTWYLWKCNWSPIAFCSESACTALGFNLQKFPVIFQLVLNGSHSGSHISVQQDTEPSQNKKLAPALQTSFLQQATPSLLEGIS